MANLGTGLAGAAGAQMTSRPDTESRPDPAKVLAGLKEFQRDTVEHAFERLYLAADSTKRFLVADEVGLGKTLVARGVIAKALEHLWDGVEQIDIVYICSNAQIARQNVRRLQIGANRFVRAGRLGLLPQEIHGLKENRVNYLALTPGTSFNLKSSMGIRAERVLLYHMLQRVWPDPRKGPMNLFQGYVRSARNFRWEIEYFRRWRRIDEDLTEAFKCRVLAEGDAFREEYEDLCRRFRRARPRIPWSDRSPQINFIGKLRAMLAEVCVSALQPDLVILDEFQRFKQLLDGDDPTALLARQLFTYSDSKSAVRMLLLSATPYRMYTLHHESAEDDHYQDFLRTVEFLDQESKEDGELRRLLGRYREAMYGIASGIDPLEAIKQEIERRLRRVMSRTERLPASREADGMMREVPSSGLQLTREDVLDYLALGKIGRQVGQPQVLDYWKSAPYLLSFMDDYKLKTEFAARLGTPAESELAGLLAGFGRASLPWEVVEAYRELDPGNARLRNLMEWMEDSWAWQLLWIPPSLPYYSESDPWRWARKRQFSKRLIFSSWQVAPKSIASVLSYEVERRIFRRFDDAVRNTPEERRKSRPLLRFAYTNERLAGMPVLGILYPSPSLADLGDPATIQSESMTSLQGAVDRARARLEPLLGELTQPYQEAAREDESWYWAAPILLDLEKHRDSTLGWFERHDLPSCWNGAAPEAEEDSRWADHVRRARELVASWLESGVPERLDLGRPPADLSQVLASRSVAGPATSALRAITRASGSDTIVAVAARDAAGRIAWGFRALFNLPEAMAIVRGGRIGDGTVPYWQQVVAYCAAGNLQAVLDEYVHTLRDLEGLFATDCVVAWDRLATAITAALTLRTGAPRVQELRAQEQKIRIEHHRMRNHFAMRFGAQERDDGTAGAREGQVRQAFNSPFWPFALASTSVGQEGLDFHAYCHAVVHWNLPSNPVDLEQREGRVHRFKGLAVRKNVAARHGRGVLAGGSNDAWQALFESASKQTAVDSGLVPYWIFPLKEGAHIERHVPALPLSRDASRFEALKRSLAIYRLVFGQPRQDDLLAFLQERLGPDELAAIAPSLSIDLSAPPSDRV